MKIIINSHAQSRAVPININGKRRTLVIGKEETVPDDWEAALRDSGIDFTVIEDDAEPAPDPDDKTEEPTGQPTNSDQTDLSLLEGNAKSIFAGLPGKSLDELSALRAAEMAGKKRSTVINAIEKAIADFASA